MQTGTIHPFNVVAGGVSGESQQKPTRQISAPVVKRYEKSPYINALTEDDMAEMTESLVDAKIGKAKAEFGGNIREAIATMNGLRSDIDAKFANMDAKFERHKVWFPGTAGGVIVAVVGLNFGVGKIFC